MRRSAKSNFVVPVTISRSNLENIRCRSRSLGAQQIQEKAAQQERFKNYVREESKKMTRNWSNSIEQLCKKHNDEKEKQVQQQSADEQRSYAEMRDQQRRAQKEQIENIEASMRRSQPGPKLLDSAAILSDCLNVQREQRQEMAFRNITNRQREIQEGHIIRMQNHQWTQEDHGRRRESHIRAARYKHELHAMMLEKRLRFEAEQRCHQMAHLEADALSRKAVEKERREMERRRLQLRQTATEAMRMAEQRRLRDKMEDQVQESLCQIHLEGKAKQEDICEKQKLEIQSQQVQRQNLAKAKIAEILTESSEKAKLTEETVMANAFEDYKAQQREKERAEVERKKKLKMQRIKYHLEEMEQEKQRKAKEEKRFIESVVNRLMNEKVSNQFNEEQRRQQIKESQELRQKLTCQWEEKIALQRANKQDVQIFTNRNCDYTRDHADFLNYATKALNKAKEGNLPVKPFVKAINEYERENFVEEKPLLPHLEVRVPPVRYDRPSLPENNSKDIIRYNINQLRALNPIITGELRGNLSPGKVE